MAEGSERLELLEPGTGNKGYDDDYEDMDETPKTSTGRETLRPKKFKGGESKWDPVKTPQLKKNIVDAMKVIEKNFPNLDHSRLEEIVVNINENGEIMVKLGSRINAVAHILFDDDGDMNESIPQTIEDILGKQISSKGIIEQLEYEKEKKRKWKNKIIKKMIQLKEWKMMQKIN